MNGDQTWTIGRVLDWTRGFFERKGIGSPRLDAELLIGHALELERIGLYLHHHKPLHPDELRQIRQLVERRSNLEPIHYILGYREFWSLTLKVDQRVLIPRPDTERVVEVALDHLDDTPCTVLDLCCGSGAIGLAIASERQHAAILATDVSSEALEVAAQNRQSHELTNIQFLVSDLFTHVEGRFDLIVSNPPYIPSADIETLMTDVCEFEPTQALDGGDDGLDFYRQIIASAPQHLAPNGQLILEIGHDQSESLKALFSENRIWDWGGCYQDLAGNDRVVRAVLRTEAS